MSNGSYTTTDLQLAAYLKAKGYRVSCKRKTRCSFIFDAVAESEVESFFNNGIIGVSDYTNALQNLKTFIFNTGVRHDK